MIEEEYKPSTRVLIVMDKIGVILSIAYFLTPLLPVIKNGCHKESLKKIPFLLLFTIVINCLLYLVFSLRDGNEIFLSMLVCNGVGLAVNFFLLISYTFELLTIGKFIGFVVFLVILMINIFCFFYLLIKEIVVVVIASSVVNTLMYTSPSLYLFRAWKKQEKNIMPLITNFIGFFDCVIWIIYGIISKHIQTYISNGISIIALSIQIVLCIKHFKRINGDSDEKEKENNEFLNEVDGRSSQNIIFSESSTNEANKDFESN